MLSSSEDGNQLSHSFDSPLHFSHHNEKRVIIVLEISVDKGEKHRLTYGALNAECN